MRNTKLFRSLGWPAAVRSRSCVMVPLPERSNSVTLQPMAASSAATEITYTACWSGWFTSHPQSGSDIVTARRRAESFQDVPVTISVFDEREIQSAGIDRPRDFVAMTPNVTLVETQNQGNAFITVRGISQARNSERSVAVLIDGVQMANPSQFNQELFDIDSIQVLKGPQGALYGRNASGGALNILTVQPKLGEYSGYVEGTAGNYDLLGAEGCKTNGIDNFDKIAFWKTPIADCGNGKKDCMDYTKWQRAWTQLKG